MANDLISNLISRVHEKAEEVKEEQPLISNIINSIQERADVERESVPEPQPEQQRISEYTPYQFDQTNLSQPQQRIKESINSRNLTPETTSDYNILNKVSSNIKEATNLLPISAVEDNDNGLVIDLSDKTYSPKEYLDALNNSSILNPNVTAFESAAKKYRDNNAQNLLRQDLERKEKFQKDFDESMINSSFGAMGFDYTQDPLYQQQVDSARNSSFDPSGVSEEVRRRLMDQSGLKSNPLEWNILGLSSQSITDPGARSLYESYFDNHKADNKRVDRGVIDQTLIDDGHSDVSRQSLYMTGEQYINYRNAGIPGRDVYDIDPNGIYSKQDEMETSGFIPYITNETSRDWFKELADMNELNNAYTHLANARRENADFDVNYNGEKYSGKELQRVAQSYRRKLAEQVNDQSRIITDPSKVTENSVPHVAVYSVVDEDTGKTQNYFGEPVSKGWLEDGSAIRYVWSDGSYADFNDTDDILASMQRNYQPAQDGQEELASVWVDLDPLQLSNGQTLRADKAQELLQQLGNEDAIDYGPLGWSNPDVQDPFQDGFLPWIADMALGSLPLFWWPTSIPQAGANATASATGMRPGADYINGTYQMLSEKPTEEQRNAAAVGSALLPITERIYGNLGSSVIGKMFKPLKNLERAHPAKQYIAGTIGEGLEEIPGNIVEELMKGYGPSEWYADAVLDENGNPIRDSQGHELRDTSTSAFQRMHNFFGDAPLSVLGGATLGGTLGLGSVPIYRHTYRLYNDPEYAEQHGFKPPAEEIDYASNIVVPLNEEETNFYNR